MLSVYVWRYYMAELIVIIKVLQLEINLLALTVLSDLDSMFIGFSPPCVEQQWPCVLSVNEDKYSINFKIKNKVYLDSKLIFNLIFRKIDLNWSWNNSIMGQHYFLDTA